MKEMRKRLSEGPIHEADVKSHPFRKVRRKDRRPAKTFDVASCKNVLAIYSADSRMILKEDRSDRL